MVPKLPDLISKYDLNAQGPPASKDNSLAACKKYAEDNNLYDSSTCPPHLQVCVALAAWLQKAHNSRGAAMAYQAENNVNLEA